MDAKTNSISALTTVQKILAGLIIAIAVGAVCVWATRAPRVKMVSILGDQTLANSDIGPIERELELGNIPHNVVAGKIMVPADRKAEVLAKLAFARVLPVDTHDAFANARMRSDPKSDALALQATADELSAVISRFPGVQSARVVLKVDSTQRIEPSVPPSATVSITTTGAVKDKQMLTRAATDCVFGAVAGLARDQVSVVIDND
jgi:flagellar M-ring protein FliF